MSKQIINEQTMPDQVYRGMAANQEIRFTAAYTRKTVEDARQIHQLSHVCTAALGRALTAGAMMGAFCKDEKEILTIRIDGNGPAGRILVYSDSQSHVKGIVKNGQTELPLKENGHLDVGGAVGHTGTLTVIRDNGIGDPYSGQISLVSGEIGEDMTAYFAESEQIPTSVGLGVLVSPEGTVLHAGGFIIQLMPFASEETLEKLENALTKVHSVTDFFKAGMSPLEMMQEILGKDLLVEEQQPVCYQCNCSRERTTRALICLGQKEVSSLIQEGKPVTLHCDFCNKDYTYTVPELKSLLSSMES